MRKRLPFVACLAVLAFVAGCSTPGVSKRQIVAAADRTAAEVLEDANRDDRYGHNRPFLLRDYTRQVASSKEMQSDEGPPDTRYFVFYETERALSFLGHPQHFTVVVDPATMATEVIGGE